MKIDQLIARHHLKSCPGNFSINWILLPCNSLVPTLENAQLFNELYQAVIKSKTFMKLKRTASGGISLKQLYFPSYDVKVLYSKKGGFKGVELVILTKDHMCRIQFANKPKTTYPGNKCFKIFWDICLDYGIDLNRYRVSKQEGLKFKEQIPFPMIRLANQAYRNLIFENCHHIDYHSSYASGLVNTHPEFRPAIEHMYNKRAEKPVFKSVLTESIGFMQSQWCQFSLAKLSLDAITDNNNRIMAIAKQLEKNPDRMVISYNTDGVWYTGPIYHDKNEGSTLGTWHHDHLNCKFRAKSDGAYEFIEAGKYTPVLRGSTLYDRVKDRNEWEWGDIYNKYCVPYLFKWVDQIGVVCYEE